jgi:pilus assembly protein Flp/PilA
MQTIKRFLSNEEGLETVEYGLVAALIVIVAIVAMQTIGPKLAAIYTQISNALG